jgi:hypothetical protein
MAEGEGFEPPIPGKRDNGFQDRRFQPLTHPSAPSNPPAALMKGHLALILADAIRAAGHPGQSKIENRK